jgi:DNA modification methylase
VFDPCAGSGTTVIAAAELGLTCFATEVNPTYCDVLRERFQRHFARAAAASAPEGDDEGQQLTLHASEPSSAAHTPGCNSGGREEAVA